MVAQCFDTVWVRFVVLGLLSIAWGCVVEEHLCARFSFSFGKDSILRNSMRISNKLENEIFQRL